MNEKVFYPEQVADHEKIHSRPQRRRHNMSFYLGHFYFDKRDLFIVLAVVLLLLGNYLHYPLPYFEYRNLIILAILFLFAKGFLLTSYDSALFATFFVAIILTLFIPLLQVLYFLSLSFIFLRLFKVI